MGVLNNINYIKKATVYKCALPGPMILIETAFRAGVPVLLELITFGCIDALKIRGGISFNCGKLIKAVIVKAHGAQVVADAHYLYKFVAPVERALWYWMVADLTTSFVANWTSLVYEAQGCIPDDDSFGANSDKMTLSTVAPNLNYPIAWLWGNRHGHFGSASGPIIFVPAGWYYSCHWSVSVTGGVNTEGGEWSLTPHMATPTGSFDFQTSTKGFAFGEASTMTTSISGSAPEIGSGSFISLNLNATNWCFGSGGHATVEMSRLPVLESNPIGMGCFAKDWSKTVTFGKH